MVRILEVSRVPLFKSCLPEETTWVRLGASLVAGDEGCVPEPINGQRAWRLARDLRRGTYDLVVLPTVFLGHLGDEHWLKRWLRRLLPVAANTGLMGPVLATLFRLGKTAVVFEDLYDVAEPCYEMCALLPGFLGYFKREFDPATLRTGARWEPINARITPWSLFLPTTNVAPDASVKKTDVFFAGICNSPARHEGVPRLRRLAAQGCRIDIPEGRLSYGEYMQRMAEAWLVWSPGGHGWDCYRHYEAAFVGSVPVIDAPAFPRALPYEDGTECFYYDFRPGGDALERTVLRALADKEHLRTVATRARARVLAQFTRRAVVARMQARIVEWLSAAGRPSRLLAEWGAGTLSA